MNRYIQYRVWDKSKGKFISEFTSFNLIKGIGNESDYTNYILQQYIGEKDYKRNKIFEGDICSWREWNGHLYHYQHIGLVYWDQNKLGVLIKANHETKTGKNFWDINEMKEYFSVCDFNRDKFQVIGNILENPTLWKTLNEIPFSELRNFLKPLWNK